MHKILNLPVKKIRRKGPNGEYLIHFKDIQDELIERLEDTLDFNAGWNIIGCFYTMHDSYTLSDKAENENWDENMPLIAAANKNTAEIKFFALKYLMPDLECFKE